MGENGGGDAQVGGVEGEDAGYVGEEQGGGGCGLGVCGDGGVWVWIGGGRGWDRGVVDDGEERFGCYDAAH